MAIDKALYQAPVGFVDEQAPPITIEIEEEKTKNEICKILNIPN